LHAFLSDNIARETLAARTSHYRMPYSRQRPRIAATGRVSVRLNTRQRDLFLDRRDVPAALAFALKNAAVRDGKLSLRVTRDELDRLIAAAASVTPENKSETRELNAFLSYLENLEDRFEEPADEE
jgi:uncharacterized protein (DUF1778 family)